MDKNIELITKTLENKKASDIDCYDVKGKSPIYDYCIIASTLNNRHLNGLKEELETVLEEAKIKIHHIEGNEASGWIIIDAYDYIIHLFSKEERARVNLDKILTKTISQ